MKTLYIIANAALGKGLSGGDRIFMELSRRWVAKGIDVHACVWEEGYEMCKRQNLDSVVKFEKWFLGSFKKLPFILRKHKVEEATPSLSSGRFIINYFFRILSGCYYAFRMRVPNNPETVIYAASDFWQDFLPLIILKLKNPAVTIITSFYLAAPNPFRGYRVEYEKKIQLPKFRDFLFYLAQAPVRLLIPFISDFIFVTSLPDKKYFVEKRKVSDSRVIIITGGVRLDLYKKYYESHIQVEKSSDAIFYGRFHPQKGVMEILDIWKLVLKRIPGAKLVMIGDGPMMNRVKERINELELNDFVILKGYMIDGEDKMRILMSSKIVVHPAVFDSGGMASAEVMAFHIPGVSFDLEALQTYYPKGMLKAKCFDHHDFAEKIIQLLTDPDLYKHTAREAYECVLENFDWDRRAEDILQSLILHEN